MSLQDALAFKIWLDLVKGLRSYGAFKLMGLVSAEFSVPLAAKLHWALKSLGDARMCSRSLSPCQVWRSSDFTCLWGGQKRLVFLSVCLSITLLNVNVYTDDFTMKALEYRNSFDTVR